MLFIDLDRFKLVNDGLGHETGDELLVAVSRRLTATVRRQDTVARIGGDEFVIALVSPADSTCETVGARILERVAAVAADYPGTGIGATIGFASFESPPADVEVLLKRADDAMYEMKQAGKGRFAVVRA